VRHIAVYDSFMKRRNFVRALVAAPVAPALLAQQPTAAPAPAAAEIPKLETAVADEAAEPMPHFFTASQFAALKKLCDLLTPGSLDARVPEFLDFYIGASGADRQHVYRTGLDALNARGFAEADSLLRAPWTYEEPSDPLARFLRVAKVDVRTATMNSKEFSAMASTGRRGGGNGLYWYPLD
jgi:hypothetical protein